MRRLALLGAAAVVLVAGCGEKVQTIESGHRKSDTPVWQTKDQRFLAPGWQPGNESSWNSQITQRAQSQNDFAPRK
jgi:hypothetical protein